MTTTLSRRRMLALSGSTLTAGLAGCGRSAGSSETVQRVVSLSDVASVPEKAKITMGVEQLTADVTADQTATFSVTTINSETKKRLSHGDTCPVF
jgi:hypothetical protein